MFAVTDYSKYLFILVIQMSVLWVTENFYAVAEKRELKVWAGLPRDDDEPIIFAERIHRVFLIRMLMERSTNQKPLAKLKPLPNPLNKLVNTFFFT